MSYGASLRRARSAANLTLRGMAKKASISPSYLSDIELGRRFPGYDVEVALYDALGEHAKLVEDIPVCTTCGRRLLHVCEASKG